MNIRPWLIHRVTRSQRTGEANAKGDAAFGAQGVVKGRVEKKTRMVKNDAGKEVVSSHSMATLTADVAVSDRFWFPSIAGEPADDVTDISDARTPVAIDRATSKSGKQKLIMVYF